jgi:hypothetical protein
MRAALVVLFAYALLNFFLFMSAPPHTTGVAPPSVLRGFSGHWMIFYAVAFATFYSVRHAPDILVTMRCANGHAVSPAAKFCDVCGAPLSG